MNRATPTEATEDRIREAEQATIRTAGRIRAILANHPKSESMRLTRQEAEYVVTATLGTYGRGNDR